MKFLISVIDSQSGSADSNEMAAIDAFNDSLRANGNWIFAWGLESPASSIVIDNRSNANQQTDGPLVNSPEYISGFWIVEAADYAEARQLAYAGSLACNRKVELRPFHN